MSQLPAQVTEACFSVCRLPTCRASWHRLSFPTPYPVLSVEMMESLLSPLEEEWSCGSISDSELENLSKWVADTWDFVNQPFVVLLDSNKYPLLEAGVSNDCSGLKGEVKVKKILRSTWAASSFFGLLFVVCLLDWFLMVSTEIIPSWHLPSLKGPGQLVCIHGTTCSVIYGLML